MKLIRRHTERCAVCLLVIFMSGVGYPVLHKIEHASAIDVVAQSRSGHSHSNHGDAVENPYPDLNADTCWICVRPVTLIHDLSAQNGVDLPEGEFDRDRSSQHAPSRFENLTSARAPPSVI